MLPVFPPATHCTPGAGRWFRAASQAPTRTRDHRRRLHHHPHEQDDVGVPQLLQQPHLRRRGGGRQRGWEGGRQRRWEGGRQTTGSGNTLLAAGHRRPLGRQRCTHLAASCATNICATDVTQKAPPSTKSKQQASGPGQPTTGVPPHLLVQHLLHLGVQLHACRQAGWWAGKVAGQSCGASSLQGGASSAGMQAAATAMQ